MQLLAHISNAKREIQAADSLLKLKDLWNKADAMRQLGQAAKDPELITYATEFKLRCERRLGEMLSAAKLRGDIDKGGHPVKTARQGSTLSDLGLSRDLSSRAQRLGAVPEAEFEARIAEAKEEEEKLTRRVMDDLLRTGNRTVNNRKPSKPFPEGKYAVIYADPPWRYEHVKTESRAIENQYPTMDLNDVCALPVSEICADDCTIFLWTTSPKLEEAFQVLKAWGFNYRTCAVWDKEKIGMGYYFRQQHELLLVATRGSPQTPEPSERVSSIIRAPRAAHSLKPETIYELLESMYPEVPRIELFCRKPRQGWAAWGNEIEDAA